MFFNSLTFLIIFLPILMLIYFMFKNIKYKNIVLLVFSFIFYTMGNPKYLLLLLFIIFLTYIYGNIIEKNRKKINLIISISILVLVLFVFKLSLLISQNSNIEILDFPIGLSFYIFQAISYLADIYNKRIKKAGSFIDLALYLSFFPQLVAGPIIRYNDIEKRIKSRKTSVVTISEGIKRFIIGLCKKVIIADTLSLFVEGIYLNPNMYGTLILWLTGFCYLLVIYYDFSGYSDMAIGLGKIFGFDFPENFNYPLKSKSITEFWKRWHITLANWFKDYVYIPLGGNRISKKRTIINIFIVWMLTSLWHGINLNFLIWGFYNCCFILFEKKFGKFLKFKYPIINYILTLIILIVSFTIFRTNNFQNLIAIFTGMFIYRKSDFLALIYNNAYLLYSVIIFVIAIYFCYPRKKIISNNSLFGIIIYLMLYLICILFILGNYYNPFIYFQF